MEACFPRRTARRGLPLRTPRAERLWRLGPRPSCAVGRSASAPTKRRFQRMVDTTGAHGSLQRWHRAAHALAGPGVAARRVAGTAAGASCHLLLTHDRRVALARRHRERRWLTTQAPQGIAPHMLNASFSIPDGASDQAEAVLVTTA